MTTVEIDYHLIKERIVAILKNNTMTLFNPKPRVIDDLFRRIDVGAPEANSILEGGQLPRIWVTNDDVIDQITTSGAIVANAPQMSIHTMRFLIIFAVSGKDGPKTEERIDDFTKVILETLRECIDLRIPGQPESGQLADNSRAEFVGVLNRDLTGTEIQGRVIRFIVKATTGA